MAAVMVLLLLPGCAGRGAFQEGRALIAAGQTDAGLAKLEEAVRLDPSNAEYRIGLTVRRASVVQQRLAAAEQARRDERPADAEKAYRQILQLDPNHAMAQQGLAALTLEAKHRVWVTDADAVFTKGGLAQADAAMERVRAVLAAEPRNRAALRLKERIDEARAREQRADTRLAEAFRKPIALQFNDAPLRAIFDSISRISGLNFFFDKDVRADARGTLMTRSTSIEDAVRLLLLTNQLEYRVLDDSSVLVYPNTPQKQKDYQPLVVRTFFLANADVKAVSNAIKAIIKSRDMVIDERLGTIMMRDTAEAVRVAERIVALQDMADPEVLLDVEVLEVKRSRLQELGLQWPGQLTLSPLASGDGGTTLSDLRKLNSGTVQATLSSAIINANQSNADANILSNPRIRVRNKEKAKILIGDRIPVITTTTSGTASFVTEAVSYVDVGLKLEVEPNVYLDDEVAIKINLEVSSLVKEVLSKNGTLAYQIGTRGATTVLRLKDGETQVLAGLISDEDRITANRVPGLGELPVLGRLFGSQKDDDQRSEILLSITPRIVRSLRRPDLDVAEFDAGTENAVGQSPMRLRRTTGAPATIAGLAAPAAPVPVPPQAGARPPASAASAAAAPDAAARRGPPPSFAAMAPTPVAVGQAARLAWQGPAQVSAGQTFSLLLRGQGAGSWREVLMQLAFDPQVLQLDDLRPGVMFDPSDGSGNLLRQGDSAPGAVRLTLARSAESVDDPARAGAPAPAADLLILTFKALRAVDGTALNLISADPQPAGASPPLLPVGHSLRVVP